RRRLSGDAGEAGRGDQSDEAQRGKARNVQGESFLGIGPGDGRGAAGPIGPAAGTTSRGASDLRGVLRGRRSPSGPRPGPSLADKQPSGKSRSRPGPARGQKAAKDWSRTGASQWAPANGRMGTALAQGPQTPAAGSARIGLNQTAPSQQGSGKGPTGERARLNQGGLECHF